METLTVKQRAALQALMTCSSRREAAAQAGIGERTLREYFRDDEFVREYDRLYGELMDDFTRELQKSLHLALKTLRDACEDPEASWASKTAAAYRILSLAPDYIMQNDILIRLEKLEGEEKL